MKKRMLTDVMGPYNLPPLEDGKKVLAFQIEQAEYFLSKMRAHKGQFQDCFARDNAQSRKQATKTC